MNSQYQMVFHKQREGLQNLELVNLRDGFGCRINVCGAQRHMALIRIFEEFKLPATVIACGLAVERNQEFAKAIKELGYDICAHGWRWEYHSLLSIENERELISKTFSSLEANTVLNHQAGTADMGRA